MEARRLREEEKKQEAQLRPIQKAREEVAEYLELIPDLTDKTTDAFQKAARKFRQLKERGYPDNDETERLAIELTHGPLDTVKAKKEMRTNTRENTNFHSETSFGGRSNGNKGSTDISKAPAHLREFWDKMRTPEADRKKEWEIYLRDKNPKLGRV